ncbi:uncharacterized protein LOC135347286 isoform X2 [Halichondria panicea]|uniref:uncharacterized protein LOC135347286 isoform X2 n=1 Tax=Halichondria panicea TaxID=6063 RepID=UPI00312B5717
MHKVSGDHNSPFLNLDSIRSKSVLLYDDETYLNQHRLYPSLTFTCNGTIDNITFLATYLNGTFGLSFSLWRTEDNSTWILQGSRVRIQDDQSQCEDDELCILSMCNASLTFEAGYRLGVRLNGGPQREYELIHLSEGGFSRYTGLTEEQRSNTTLTFNEMDGAVPLLTIETDHPECVQGFLSKDVFMHAAAILNYTQTISNSNDQFEFELQQCLCLAQVTDLLFAGSFDPAEKDVSTTNLTINLTIIDSNTSETVAAFSLSNQTVQMTDTLNIFKYVLNFSRIELQTRNVSVEITLRLDGGIIIIPSSPVVPVCCAQDNIIEHLMFTSLFIDNIENEVSMDRLLLFPDMTFQASGNISLWTFTARRDTSIEESSEIEFLVWRPSIKCDTINTEYELVGSNAVTDAKPTEFLNVYEYSVPQSNQIQVQEGDVFAVFQSGGDAFSPVFVTDIGHLYYKPQLNLMNRNREKMEFVSSGHYLFLMVSFIMTMTGGDPIRSNTTNNCTDETTMPDDDGTGLLGIIFACVTVGLVALIILVVIWLVIMLVRNRKKNTDTPVSIPGDLHMSTLARSWSTNGYETIPPILPTRNEAEIEGPIYSEVDQALPRELCGTDINLQHNQAYGNAPALPQELCNTDMDFQQNLAYGKVAEVGH